ncbi:hypothetical protein RAE19_04295 [Rhodoferax sp. TBRC 17660]|uniref:HTH OST-type domain-containing protein n=1 Tax=Rhodoferax potami TaxID=3068338 RepID=A0ABU3KL24_9BURK|nr:hypothetical protein [Rhodoferax sp. TBRC 17660]MDT7517964.1 hypothetical protein [Rhodoferax sp. TBRC 17660]
MEEPLYAELQREVQRKLGRCLIRIQQYELLLKEMLAKREVSLQTGRKGLVPEDSESNFKTLGQLAGELTDEYFQPTLTDAETPLPDKSTDEKEQPPGSFHLSFSVSIAPEAHAKMVKELQELVDLRNDLVHHFLEGQDLLSEQGCIAADMYLQDCYSEIDRHLASLREWAKSSNESKLSMAAFVISPEFQEFLLAGMKPSSSEREGALPKFVEVLRQAEGEVAIDGWTPLSAAIEFAKGTAPDVTLKTHRFGSWRQVLSEARVFEVSRLSNAVSI